MQPKWLVWAQQIQAIAQKGLNYSTNPFQVEDYKLLREIAADIISSYSQIEQSEILDLLLKEIGYPTPKVAVRGVVFKENTLLFVKERSDGCYALPGGWAEVGESPGEVAVREIFEESGYQTRPVKLLAVYDINKQGYPPHPHGIYKLFFQCEIIGGSPTSSIETEEVKFFAEDNIPQLSPTRVTPAQITRFFQHYYNRDLPTDFD
ncbi:MAG: NUDIX hydrolase [Richelia sp. RM2_1_2]|nr:NUDIX hydrolase [Richelia sp. SM1_7_0]NJN10751.1 NUDIX hydrolase [Richelia sp. RM1_1_1]NJO29152.1 NUDIX hydrolase [Richelia sp. SL_2_1]NJO58173.1 NUDIX hydrolase [Richelia sp. RM2_1_2]